MRLRSIIRTISASLTTAIIVYALIEEISKEAKASENVPDNFIPEWFFEQHCADLDDYAYKVNVIIR